MAHVPDSTYRGMMLALPGFDQSDALARIAVPTLVLAGCKDGNAPAAMMRRMADVHPGRSYTWNWKAAAIWPTWNGPASSTPLCAASWRRLHER